MVLDNCPRCGSEPKLYVVYGMPAITCTGCASSFAAKEKEKVIEDWQNRADDADVDQCPHCGGSHEDPIYLSPNSPEYIQGVALQCAHCRSAVAARTLELASSKWTARKQK